MDVNDFMWTFNRIPFNPIHSATTRVAMYDHMTAHPSKGADDLYASPVGHCIDFPCGWRFVVWQAETKPLFVARLATQWDSPMRALKGPENWQWLSQVAAASLIELSMLKSLWIPDTPSATEPLRLAALVGRQCSAVEREKNQQLCHFWAKRLIRGLADVGIAA